MVVRRPSTLHTCITIEWDGGLGCLLRGYGPVNTLPTTPSQPSQLLSCWTGLIMTHALDILPPRSNPRRGVVRTCSAYGPAVASPILLSRVRGKKNWMERPLYFSKSLILTRRCERRSYVHDSKTPELDSL